MGTRPMTRDQQCVQFLQWALPRLGYRWAGFRKVRRQVCRRILKRASELGLVDLAAYRSRLEAEADEWSRLDSCCRVTISRFYRDRGLWEALGEEVLPSLYERAAGRDSATLRIWSAGCGAGEEPYTMAMLLRLGPVPLPASLGAEIVATDLDVPQLERARGAAYPESCLRELPEAWRREAFTVEADGERRLRSEMAESVRFVTQDIRRESPDGAFDLILCRNLVFTYFDESGRTECLARLAAALEPHGWLAVGGHENPGENARWARHRSGAPLFALAVAPRSSRRRRRAQS